MVIYFGSTHHIRFLLFMFFFGLDSHALYFYHNDPVMTLLDYYYYYYAPLRGKEHEINTVAIMNTLVLL
jgi:hypothetical protein